MKTLTRLAYVVGLVGLLSIESLAFTLKGPTTSRLRYRPDFATTNTHWKTHNPSTAIQSSLKSQRKDSAVDDFFRYCKTVVPTTFLWLFLMCAPLPFQLKSEETFLWMPPAWAEQVVQDATRTQSAAVLPDPMGTSSAPIDASSTKLLRPLKAIQEKYSPIDEVWTLVNKYYIDRSFGGKDWNAVRENYKSLEKGKDEEESMSLVTEMVKTLGDKYSRVLDVKAYGAIQKYDLIGVGVTLMPNENKQIIVGAPPVAGSASAEAGMKVGDYVVAVNGVPTDGRTAFDLIDQISEIPNAKTITMTVKTPGSDENGGEAYTRDIVMERAFREINNPVRYKISETRGDGTKVGFIRILEFNSLVKARLEDAISSLQKEGANAYVIDLRGNPGGAFQSAVEISSLFVDDRVATYVVDSNQIELPFRTASGRVVIDPKVPIALWVDGGSASASEVLAGSLHDNCRAVVMGDQSFGKGLIQAVYGLKNGAGLVLTVARYVTPNGTNIQGSGITPDIKGHVPLFIPGISTDTSKVDFHDISRRLEMCPAPSR